MALSRCEAAATDRQGRELAAHGTPLFPVACYHDDLCETPVPWHWHEELEALVIETGAARLAVSGDERVLHAGEGCFLNTGALHAVWPEGPGPCRLRSLVFHPRLVGGGVDSLLWQKYLEPLLSDRSRPCVVFRAAPWEREAAAAVGAAWQACTAEEAGFEFAVREQLSRLILLLAQHCPAAEKSPSEGALRASERIKTMLQYIQQHYAEPLTLADIARSAAVSENECLRCFRRMVGASPIQYLKQLRIQKAAALLRTTDQKISAIGAACGFQEMSYFARTFRQLQGCTPGAYRRAGAGMGERAEA